MTIFPLATNFVVLDASLRATARPAGPTFYEDLGRDFGDFHGCTLIAQYSFTENWPTWECHPAGDEILYLVAGKITFLIRTADGEQQLTMATPGQTAIVPKGCWHTGLVTETATVLFITPGEGTENRTSPG